MDVIDEAAVRSALSDVVDDASGRDIVALGLVTGITLVPETGGTKITVVLETAPAALPILEPARLKAEKALYALQGVAKASVILTAHRKANANTPHSIKQKIELPSIRFIIAIASGKGGVGKSTTAVNLALALRHQGLRVGLLDGDIYGPSIPRMFGIANAKPAFTDKKIQPVLAHGIATMSIGLMVAEENAVVWRGPMVQGALLQMLRDVAWGDLDILLVDLPPGTGDVQLTLAQQAPLNGAIIVSTPQDIALIDARKAASMFKRVNVPVLGIIENMSYFICPHCQGRSDIFAHGGAKAEAGRMGCDFLGEVPLHLTIRQNMDEGTPLAFDSPGPVENIYDAVAQRLWHKIEVNSEPKKSAIE